MFTVRIYLYSTPFSILSYSSPQQTSGYMKVLFAKVTLKRENGSLTIWIVTYHCETWSTWYILPLLLNVGLLIYSVWSFYTSLFVLPLEKEFKIQKWKDTGFKFEIAVMLLKIILFFDAYPYFITKLSVKHFQLQL